MDESITTGEEEAQRKLFIRMDDKSTLKTNLNPKRGELTKTEMGSCHKHQKPQAPTPQAPIRNRQTRKVANAKGLNRNTNLT